MALNIQTLKTRSLTAVIFVVIMLLGLLWNKWAYLLLFTIIHFGCWYEFIKLLKLIQPKKIQYYLPLGILYITIPYRMMINFVFEDSISKIAIGTEHLKQPSFFMVAIIPCAIIFSIWVNDTMAYIVGSLIGKTPFSKISPKKTWEGTLGGAILCVLLIGFVFSTYLPLQFGKKWHLIAAICAIFGTAGDLLESKLKRMANVKDSGSIMPGHGGFLDRFDSFLLAVPFVWLYVKLFT
jgi:phosphatidate cytidylyltransferase